MSKKNILLIGIGGTGSNAVDLLYQKIQTLGQKNDNLIRAIVFDTDTGDLERISAATVIPLADPRSLGTVIKASPAFAIITEAVDKLAQGNGLIYEFISINLLAGVTGSASGGLSIALTTLSDRLLATGINPEILHRVASISANGLDSMPWCGAVMTMFAVCGVTHKDSYRDVAVVNIGITMTGAILAIILGSMGVC